MKKCLILILFCICNQTLRAFDFYIRTVAYTDYDFNFENGYSDTIITILGWAKDGKMLYEAKYYGDRNYYVIDLVEDDIIWSANAEFMRIEHRPLSTTANEDVKLFISANAKRFNIEPIVGSKGEFPYRDNNNEYNYSVSEEREPADIKFNNNDVEIDVFIRQNLFPYKAKKINTLATPSSWMHNNIVDNLEFQYVKSPFENRIAVIVGVPQTHSEWDFVYYDYRIYGCHLSTGFILEYN
jgi:hypothetical protein